MAARGIDISGVDLIVQYRMPQDADSYVHRSGAPGRPVALASLSSSPERGGELRNLEHRANVRFTKSGPPSTATVMAAAAELVPRRLRVVQPKVQNRLRRPPRSP